MRLLWISCLLIGSITCIPVAPKQQGVPGSDAMWNYWFRGSGGNSDSGASGSSGSGSTKPPQDQNSGPVSDGSSDVYTGPSYHDPSLEQSDAQGVYVVGHPDDGQFFTDVTDLEPVYSFSSRSRYQRGRVVFSQTRYTPTESLEAPVQQYDYYGKTPTKGGSQGQTY